MLQLGVNVDHVATVRQARLASRPCPVEAALECEKNGAWGITAHLREDRRHINDRDMAELKKRVQRLNMEMAVTPEMLDIASSILPHSACLVPEKRQELTTEGGLEVAGNLEAVSAGVQRLQSAGIIVSLFIAPCLSQVEAAYKSGAEYIEMHTGKFAEATGEAQIEELQRLIAAAELGHSLGLKINAGHGIDYENIALILRIPHLRELNIGHSIVARAVMVGMGKAVAEMVALMRPYSG